ncbi:MAG: serine/threonine-protein kinase PknK [Sandaracinaceae bacterium]
MTPAEPVLFGSYQLLERLAQGGMAEVFKAKSYGVEGFEKILVIKRILPELSSNRAFVDMFINEAKIAVTLSHANVVQVFDLGRAEGSYYIAMEYVAGYDFATVLRRGRRQSLPLPQELAVYVTSEVAKALEYAHRRRDTQERPLRIVHRDVSPQNVLLSFEGEVKLTDFGIAQAARAVGGASDTGLLKGKYAYMSPEQAWGREVDARTDLFALGIVLYEALAGENPFHVRSSPDETLERVREGRARPVGEVRPELPPELVRIVDRAMSPRPEERHEDAGALYEELMQFLYASGRRVGAHDLAAYLEALDRTTGPGVSRSETGLRAAFSSTAASARTPNTQVDVPGGATRSPTHERRGGRRRRTASGMVRAALELRDVTVLAVRCEDPSTFERPSFERLLSHFGGMRHVTAPPARSGASVLVLFGLRSPDGRDTEAAARCALRLTALGQSGSGSSPPTAPVQLGLHPGRIRVHIDGRPVQDAEFEGILRRAGTLAERAEGGPCTSEAGERALAGLFRMVPVDGSGHVVRIEAERSLADATGRFVGRREELRRIGEVLSDANKGVRRVVVLRGEAGSGKTRLLLETQYRLLAKGHDVGVLVATCSRHRRDVPLAGVHAMLRSLLGLDELDDDDTVREKASRLRELGLGPPDMAAVRRTLGVAIEPDRTRGMDMAAQLAGALTRIAAKLAEDRLTILAWDAAEAMDAESRRVLASLATGGPDARLVVVLAERPAQRGDRPDLGSVETIDLAPLSDDEVEALVEARLGAEALPPALLREVTAKAGGNPLYVEEYLKALSDAGALRWRDGRVTYDAKVAEVEVPKTLRGIVATRLDRLDAKSRHLLHVAAVAGDPFTSDLLAHVTRSKPEPVLQLALGLVDKGLLTRHGPELGFAHPLVGEVVREGLPLESRRELHGQVAEALEALHPERLDELAERLASHYREAGDRATCVNYLVRAAGRLEADRALSSAMRSLKAAIDVLGHQARPDRDRIVALYRRLGDLAFRSRRLEEGAALMVPAIELCEELGRQADVAHFSMQRGRLLVHGSTSAEEGRRWLERAYHLAQGLHDEALLRDVVLARAEAALRAGEHRRSAEGFEEALRLAQQTGDAEVEARCLTNLALARASSGDLVPSLAVLDQARRLGGKVPDRFAECEQRKVEALVRFLSGDHAGAVEAGTRALEMAKEHGFTYEAAANAHNVGEAHLRLGDERRAFSALRYSYELARDHGYQALQWANKRLLGFIDASRFGRDEGRQQLLDAIRYAEERGFYWDLVQGLYYLAVLDQRAGRLDEASTTLRRVLAVASTHGHPRFARLAESGLEDLEQRRPLGLPG